MSELKVVVEFTGGAELLFDTKRKELTLPCGEHQVWTIKNLVKLLAEKHLKERRELFVDGDNVRPGILVLVNDVDWELMGELSYELQPSDKVLFISTLHGG